MSHEMTKGFLAAGVAIAALVTMPTVSWSQPAAGSKGSPEAAAKAPATSEESKTPEASTKAAAKTATESEKSKTPVYGPTLSKSDRVAIDLFPTAVLSNLPQQPEKSRGVSLGDDRSWKVQAAQVGAMAIGFAALVGLCGSGNCMIPGSAANALLPSFLESETNVVTPSPRQVQPIRKLR